MKVVIKEVAKTEIKAAAGLSGIINQTTMLAALAESVASSAGVTVKITKIEVVVKSVVTTKGTKADFGSAATPTKRLTAFVAGVAEASGVNVSEVGGIKVNAARRRLLAASVSIHYAITTTPAKARAAKVATEGGGFGAALATATVAAAKAVGEVIVFETPVVAKPKVETKVQYTVTVDAKAAAKVATAIAPAALVSSLNKVDAALSLKAADMTQTTTKKAVMVLTPVAVPVAPAPRPPPPVQAPRPAAAPPPFARPPPAMPEWTGSVKQGPTIQELVLSTVMLCLAAAGGAALVALAMQVGKQKIASNRASTYKANRDQVYGASARKPVYGWAP